MAVDGLNWAVRSKDVRVADSAESLLSELHFSGTFDYAECRN
jgi:hypothetical protein